MNTSTGFISPTASTSVIPVRSGRAPSIVSERYRILLLESDDAFRAQLYSALTLQGYDVFACDSSHHVLNMLHATDLVDLLISDLDVPLCAGLGVALSASLVRTSMPIIVTTKEPHSKFHALIKQRGWQLLQKPFGVEELFFTMQKKLPESLRDYCRAC